MAFLGKDYSFVKEENFDGFLRSVGIPEEKIQALKSFTPTQKFELNGDTYTYTTQTPSGPKITTFKSGVEFDDTVGPDNVPIKNTYTVEGNTVTQVIKGPMGSGTFTRVFNDDGFELTIKTDKWDGVAKRWYKA